MHTRPLAVFHAVAQIPLDLKLYTRICFCRYMAIGNHAREQKITHGFQNQALVEYKAGTTVPSS